MTTLLSGAVTVLATQPAMPPDASSLYVCGIASRIEKSRGVDDVSSAIIYGGLLDLDV
jgi:hypothetical protein